MDLFEGGKWKKYHIFLSDEILRPSVPETALFSEDTLWNFLNKYNKVILKPLSGCGGRGILKVSKSAEKLYEVHIKNKKEFFQEQGPVYDFIRKYKRPRPYLVQRCIELARIENCPFDLRVVVQRKRGASWEVTGTYAKVARQGYIVTNLARRGKVLPLATALGRAGLQISQDFVSSEVHRIALRTAEQLSKIYSDHHIWGLDMGIDQEGHTWVIEANPTPRYTGFRKLKDKSMYRKIQAYIDYNSENNLDSSPLL